jgi:hypothetical protein
MSAVLKPLEQPSAHSDYVAHAARAHRRLEVVPTTHESTRTIAFPGSSPRNRPVWLKFLIAGQRVSFAVAALTVTGALSAYALTVDSNRRLTTATTTLSRLQDYQQQITTANAVLKNHLTASANAAIQDGTLHPRDVIFLELDQATVLTTSTPENREVPKPEQRFFPKGY